MKNNQRIILKLIFFVSLMLCIETIFVGYDKFTGVTSGLGGNYPTFPSFSSQLRISLCYILVNLIYFIWLARTARKTINYNFWEILNFVKPLLLLFFIAYPLGSDIYLYLHYGLMNLSGVNPYINAASSFTSYFTPFLRWQQTSTYGPISQILFTISASGSLISPLVGIYLFKAICLAFHIVNAYLIWRILGLSRYRTIVVIGYLIHPLLLFEHVANAHIDVLLSTTLIGTFLCLQNQKYFGGFLSILSGFLTKTLPIIYLPLLSLFTLRKKSYKQLVAGVISILSLFVVLQSTLLPTADAWKSLFNPGVGIQLAGSPHQLLFISLRYFTDFSNDQNMALISRVTFLFNVVFAIHYCWICFRLCFKKGYTEDNLIVDIGWSILVLFSIATPWRMAWYGSILLIVAAVKFQHRVFVLATLAFCFFKYFLLSYLRMIDRLDSRGI